MKNSERMKVRECVRGRERACVRRCLSCVSCNVHMSAAEHSSLPMMMMTLLKADYNISNSSSSNSGSNSSKLQSEIKVARKSREALFR